MLFLAGIRRNLRVGTGSGGATDLLKAARGVGLILILARRFIPT
jgi:hypothetical protein